MNIEEWNWNLIFTGISTFCAIIGIPSAIISFRNKNETSKIKEEVFKYKEDLMNKDDLMTLTILKPKIQVVSKKFCELSVGVNLNFHDDKSEIE